MSITVGQLILDAQRVANGVKDLEARTNALLVEAEGNNRQIETMKQFRDDLDSLNKLCRDKSNADMVNRINQQNPSMQEIRQENRELKASLEDHQRALELIMHKYREHMQNKILNSKINLKESYNAKLSEVIRRQEEKIAEMAAVMQKAAAVDDEAMNREMEQMQRLRIENQGLREMLQISRQFGSTSYQCVGSSCSVDEKAIQTESDGDTTATTTTTIAAATVQQPATDKQLLKDNTNRKEKDAANYDTKTAIKNKKKNASPPAQQQQQKDNSGGESVMVNGGGPLDITMIEKQSS